MRCQLVLPRRSPCHLGRAGLRDIISRRGLGLLTDLAAPPHVAKVVRLLSQKQMAHHLHQSDDGDSTQARSLLVAAVFCLASPQVARAAEADEGPAVPLAPMHGVPLPQSLPGLVAEGWQIVGISTMNRVFAYHLVKQGALAFCLSDITRRLPASECLQLIDGVGPAPGGSPPPR